MTNSKPADRSHLPHSPAHPTGEPIAGREAPSVTDDMPHWKATQVIRSMERALVLNAVPAPNGKRWNDMADYLVMALSNAAALAQDNVEAAKPVAWIQSVPFDRPCVPGSERLTMTDGWKGHLLLEGGEAKTFAESHDVPLYAAIDASAAQDAEPVAWYKHTVQGGEPVTMMQWGKERPTFGAAPWLPLYEGAQQ